MTTVAAGSMAAVVYLLLGRALGLQPRVMRRHRSDGVGASRSRRRRERLHQAGVRATPTQVMGLTVGMGSVTGSVLHALWGVVALSMLGGGAVAWLPRAAIRRRRRARVDARRAAWPDAVRDLAAHLLAGASIHTALCRLAATGPPPLRATFLRYRTLSQALEGRTALEIVREDLADPTADRIIGVLLVAFDQGAMKIVGLLEDLARAVTADLRLEEEIRTLQLETMLEARGSALLPFAVLGLLCATSEEYLAFYRSGVGTAVILIGAGFLTGGLLLIERLARPWCEERLVVPAGAP